MRVPKTCFRCKRPIREFEYKFLGKISKKEGKLCFAHMRCPTITKDKKKRVKVVNSKFTLTPQKLKEYVEYYKQKKLRKYEVIKELYNKKENPANIVGVVQSAFNTSRDKTETYVKMVLYKIRKGILK